MSKNDVKNTEPAKLDTEVNGEPEVSQQEALSDPIVESKPEVEVKGKTYLVAYGFIDKNDRHSYAPGDVFPFDGRKIDEKRIAELSTKKNDTSIVLIKEQ